MVRTVISVLTAAAAGLLQAAPATAGPACTDTAPFTRMCVNPGHTAITTTPNPALTNPWPGWGFTFGTPVFGLGGGGLWIGI